MLATLDTTIREIVATDYRTAAVFERHGLDFCCNGCRTIEQGCRDAGADERAVMRELEGVLGTPAIDGPDFKSWSARALIDHIVSTHHAYVREAIPRLRRHTQKIAEVHGVRHSELSHIARLFGRVADEMTDHMQKEEQILFPFIAAQEEAARQGRPVPPSPFGTVGTPIRMMETEHQFVGDAMAEMRQLTGGFRPPDDGCGTYRVCLQELDAFERDLHAHVHLENNILFPAAMAVESGARS